ncbi:MAG TPA: TAXI family TRAP transporter solute-binding subunit [Alphaproteobacteria bacterium]|nr:TAXI family TRAP transporter solute-binding subunit [Alphaproteobacteria bacterium]
MRDYLKVYLPIALIVAAGFFVAYRLVDPAPSSTLRIATGGRDGAYAAASERYKAILARDGVKLEIVHTAGALENLKLLADPESKIDLAFVQGGTGSPEAMPNLVSLASVFFEPLWIFVRSERPPRNLMELAGKRVAVGVEGSGTRALALELLGSSGVFERATQLADLGGSDAVQALLKGEVDAAFFVTARPTPMLSPLLGARGIRLFNMEHAEAYKFRHQYLTSVNLPAGVISLDPPVPAQNVALLAPAAALVARDGLHPALIDLVLGAAKEVHGRRQLFSSRGEFPSPAYLDFPLERQAQRYLESGPSLLRRYLPFQVAGFVERLWVLVLPLLTLAIPLMRIAPPAYRWQVRRKIYRWYKHLRRLEDDLWSAKDAKAKAALLDRLNAMQRDVGKVGVPLSYAEQLYHLRLHIEFLRQRVEALRPAETAGSAPQAKAS